MRILVTGSRTWTDRKCIRAALLDVATRGGPPTIVHGACPRGADRIADVIARQQGWPLEHHPAEWDLHGRRAGFVRNTHMVALGADVCLAFIHERSKGASMCADLAERAGIRTVRFEC